MSRCILAVCLLAGLAISTVSAQQMESASGAEIGTLFGLSRFSTDGEGATLFGVPSAPASSTGGNPSIYISWFPDERLSIGPEFSLGRVSADGNSFTSLYLSGRGEFHSGGEAASGAYLLGHGALRVINAEAFGNSESETDYGLGAGLGYRWRVGNGSIVRAEAGYRRWFGDAPTNEFALLLGLGARAGRPAADRETRSSHAEIGTLFGLSYLNADEEAATLIGVPSALGSIVAGNPSIYVSWFPGERFSIGPEFSLGRTSGDGNSIRSLYLAGRGAFHSGGGETSGGYVFGRGALRVIGAEAFGESESETDVGLGVGLGYRWRVGPGFIVRAEGGYRRWFDDPGVNDFSLLMGLGAIVGGS